MRVPWWGAYTEDAIALFTDPGLMQSQLSGVAVAVAGAGNGSATACQARLRELDEAAQAASAPGSRGFQPDHGAHARVLSH
ncbi:hypothetical protein A9Q02_18345 [Candidatus Chloroploca asiatica]|uniref:Uncharacterized protein n=1 Tax=Candidatus Chloroploca asiatica TaxID=1506545 RepID=A0A2H3KQL5_9CHLR|nr:hypothetical protein A9Q02_18345 [Candidatus Chloroploca asiatica]